jgi:hypothetical protein
LECGDRTTDSKAVLEASRKEGPGDVKILKLVDGDVGELA